jgi:5-methyltetrahydrofolate--homocysteine methyltransferase
VDYRSFKKKWGSLACLAGNIDIEFPLAHGTPEQVEADVKAHMDVLKPGGGYVCGSSHSIVNYIPHENFIAMLNAIHKYGAYEDKAWAPGAKKAAAPKAMDRTEKIREADLLKELKDDLYRRLFDQVYRGDCKGIGSGIQAALEAGRDPLQIIAGALTPAIRAVGDKFSAGELFLPELLMAASAMQAALKTLAPLLGDRREAGGKGRVMIGTIEGDLHDIGKNIVKALLEGNGFQVVDIGVDNSPEKYVQAVKAHQPQVVGYSGLLTTTLAGMPEQMAALREAGLRDRVITIVGGAPVSEDFAKRNGVDLYGKDANEAVKVIERALSRGRRAGGA